MLRIARQTLRLRQSVVPLCLSSLAARRLSSWGPLSGRLASIPTPTSQRVATAGLRPHPGSRHAQKRLGRGPSSGRGGTSTRGHKGQSSRSGNGKPKPGFEGGQTPITRRFPKRGFYNQTAREWAPINLDRLQHWIDQGRILSTSTRTNPITANHLIESRCIHNVKDGVKLLGDGAQALRTPIHIVVSRASKSAIAAIEKAGGSVVSQYYNKLALKDVVHGRTDRKSAAPTRKQDILWYSDSRHRGYLSPLVRGDTEGVKAEVEARIAKRREMRATQPRVEYPVFKLQDMLRVPKHAQAPR